MSTAIELLEECDRRGLTVTRDGGMLNYRPRAAMTPELMAALGQRKTELLMILRYRTAVELAWALVAQETGVGLDECRRALDEVTAAGHRLLDADRMTKGWAATWRLTHGRCPWCGAVHEQETGELCLS